eukprot:CAMPEP_0178912360 /NCGR_PEP_ID=MMETSP0786-20121207/10218_1 /TAXON_ID=186022 /ORGANISM="Thalassionema frauenfeldii, Strain CCMP 1798" /LENGTH=239 /DNA_ID=CAMNT_0020584931 /DNA_START=153 /DNA_END=869 /DNA_ORIENTATION=+
MPRTKKRKTAEQNNASSLWNITGVANSVTEESIDDLLDELESKPAETVDKKLKTSVDDHGAKSSKSIEPFDFSKNLILPRNKVEASAWNNALSNWIKNGKYSEGLLPNFDLEIARHFQIEKLSGVVLSSDDEIRMPSFERWIIDSKLEEEKCKDSVIPNASTATEASQRLKKELSQRLDGSQAEAVLGDLCHQTSAALQELTALQRRTRNKCPMKKGDRLYVEDRDDGMIALLYGRKSW